MKNVILITLLASTLGFGTAAVHANESTTMDQSQSYSKQENGKGKKGKRRGGRMMKRIIKQLDLTEAQQAKLKALRDAGQKPSKSLRQQQLASVLTTEQLAKFEELKKQHKPRGGKRKGQSEQ